MPKKIVGFSGSQNAPSKTRALVELATTRLAARYGAVSSVFELEAMQPSLGTARTVSDLSPAARAIADAIVAADVLVVGAPVYKGSYPGLFKHVFDLLDPTGFAGKPVLLTATGGGEKHALVIEHQLRPLFGFFEAATAPTGIYASPSDFIDGQPASPAILVRVERAIGQFAPWLDSAANEVAA